MDARLVFMGSPDFALPTLRSLAERYAVAGVFTQPDRPAGRGRELTPPPVKILAQSLGLPVIQPRRLKEPEAVAQLEAWRPDLIVVAAFGQILRPAVLDLPPRGCINVHASLLPRWRGAAPVAAAILHGDEESGVTIMRMDPGVDTGPLLSQRSTPILLEETAGELSARLAELGASLLIETLPAYLDGSLRPQEQDEAGATYAPMLKKEDGALDFHLPAVELARRVRAFNPWPGAYTTWNGQMLKVLRARAVDRSEETDSPGTPLVVDSLPAFATAHGNLVLEEVQLAGKKPVTGKAFLNGVRAWA